MGTALRVIEASDTAIFEGRALLNPHPPGSCQPDTQSTTSTNHIKRPL
jgi:hypothetical protein